MIFTSTKSSAVRQCTLEGEREREGGEKKLKGSEERGRSEGGVKWRHAGRGRA